VPEASGDVDLATEAIRLTRIWPPRATSRRSRACSAASVPGGFISADVRLVGCLAVDVVPGDADGGSPGTRGHVTTASAPCPPGIGGAGEGTRVVERVLADPLSDDVPFGPCLGTSGDCPGG
jgi:hypothetical protein